MYEEIISAPIPEENYRVPELVQLACTFQSHITIRSRNSTYNAKSIMGMMSMDPRNGSLQICAEGEDEKEAVTAIISFLTSGM